MAKGKNKKDKASVKVDDLNAKKNPKGGAVDMFHKAPTTTGMIKGELGSIKMPLDPNIRYKKV